MMMLAAGSSCNKCYDCKKQVVTKTTAGIDTTLNYDAEYCRNGKEGAGTNLKATIEDIEKNGYTCTAK